MKGRPLSEGVAPAIAAALSFLEVDPDEAVVWWQEDGDAQRILVASSIGLLTYRFGELPQRFDEYQTVLEEITPWSDVRVSPQTVTKLDPVSKLYGSAVTLDLKGMEAKARANSPEAAALGEFAAECLRRSTATGPPSP